MSVPTWLLWAVVALGWLGMTGAIFLRNRETGQPVNSHKDALSVLVAAPFAAIGLSIVALLVFAQGKPPLTTAEEAQP